MQHPVLLKPITFCASLFTFITRTRQPYAMLSYYFITLVLSKVTMCQINGEFWWMNENFAKLQNIEPPKPKFEELSEWETDESVKVVFKEHSVNSSKGTSGNNNKDVLFVQGKILPYIVFVDRTKLAKQDYIEPSNITTNKNSISTNNISKNEVKKATNTASWKEKKDRDEFEFLFPDDFQNLQTNSMNNSKDSNSTNNDNNKNQKQPKIILDDKIWFEDERKTDSETESICTFVTPHECFLRKGLVNMPRTCPTNTPVTCKICCVLPLVSSKLRNPHLTKRHKRSDPGEVLSAALKQRNALVLRNYNTQAKLATTTSRTNLVQKIVTPSDYVDPYWNIKEANLNSKQKSNQDYEDYYAPELPKPGLLGAYSNRDDRITSWKLKTDKGFSYDGKDEDSDEDYDGGFGYSTIDPRLGTRKTTASKPRRRPQRLMTPSTIEDATETIERQTIRFHSTPDFHVLEGFKLVNLAENKNRFSRKTTPKMLYPSEEEIENTSLLIADEDLDNDDAFDRKLQVFKNCGKERIKVLSEAGSGATKARCDPWLMVVVLTKNPQNVLCYATIVHPLAALTAASCVHGKSTGEISAIAGVWDIKERAQSQQRMASIHVHPQFSTEGLANDLAILHWKRPLQPPNALPACLADPHVGDECYFVGWGGYDQPLRRRPQWQRAAILTPRSCNAKISSPEVDLPDNAFCASVTSRGTVTGVGGPLLCKGGGRVSVVGVAVYREDVVILLPAYEWVTSALRELLIS